MSPLKRFLDGPHANAFANAADSTWLQEALHTAFLVTVESLPSAVDVTAAAANEFRRQGALALCQTLERMSNRPNPVKPPIGNLDHNN